MDRTKSIKGTRERPVAATFTRQTAEATHHRVVVGLAHRMAAAQGAQGFLDHLEEEDGDQGLLFRPTEDHHAGVRLAVVSQGEVFQVGVHLVDQEVLGDREVNAMTLGAPTGAEIRPQRSTEEDCQWAGTITIWRTVQQQWHKIRERGQIEK